MRNLANALAFIKTLIDNDNLVNVIDSKVSNQQLQHFIHWRGYDANDTFGRQLNICQMPWKKMKKKNINDFQTSLKPSIFMKFITSKGSDVTNTIFT
jgi:hypothetical protein